MSNTPNLDLKKMDGDPKATNFNHKEFYENNFDKIDAAVGAKPTDLTTTAKTIIPAINELKSDKVDKETGKGLSTNDFDNTYKQKIDTDIPAQLADIEQDVTDHENRILDVEAIMKSVEIKSWQDVQKIVRAGIADKVFTVGDSFVAKYNGVDYLWDIIGINHDEPSDPQYTHSLTLQSRDCLMNCVFDAAEPTNPNTSRAQYGSNNYLQSNIRQWLNSEDSVFNFTPQTPYDVKPTGAPYNGAGFLYNLDPDLRAVIGQVKKQVAKNTTTDGGGQDLFQDKVFLLSKVEAYGGVGGVSTGEKPYEYYSLLAPVATTAGMPGRIKYLSGSARSWWLRSPNVIYAQVQFHVNPVGSIPYTSSFFAIGLVPACTIY